MAENLNVVALTGNLTRDPELRTTQGGTSICKMRIAVNERTKEGGEWTERANYFDITVWGKQGENCAQYLAKGRPIAVRGRLRWHEWEGENGKRSAVDVTADSVQFLGTGRSENGGGESSGGSGRSDVPNDDSDFEPRTEEPVGTPADDIPF